MVNQSIQPPASVAALLWGTGTWNCPLKQTLPPRKVLCQCVFVTATRKETQTLSINDLVWLTWSPWETHVCIMCSLPPSCLQRWHHSSVGASVIQTRTTEAGSGNFVGPWCSLHVRGRGPAPPVRELGPVLDSSLVETQVSQCSWGLAPAANLWTSFREAQGKQLTVRPWPLTPQHWPP